MRAENEVNSDVQDLWKAVFGEPPSVEAPARMLIEVLVDHLPAAPYPTIRRNGVEPPIQQDRS